MNTKKMFELLNTFMSNKDSMKDPESMVKLVEPLMKGKKIKREVLILRKWNKFLIL